MKKYYIKDLKENELQKVFENNEKIQQEAFNDAYESNMQYQLELGKIFFGDNSYSYLEIKDYYSSFYLKIKDPIRLFENLSLSNSDYLNEIDSKTYIDLYKKAQKYYNYFNNCSYSSDNYWKNIELLENTLEKIIDILEKELHKLEDVTKEDALENFIFNVQENYLLEDAYILNKKDFIVYEKISYIKKYN